MLPDKSHEHDDPTEQFCLGVRINLAPFVLESYFYQGSLASPRLLPTVVPQAVASVREGPTGAPTAHDTRSLYLC